MVRKKFIDIMLCFLEESEIWKLFWGILFWFLFWCNIDFFLFYKIISCVDLNVILDMLKIEIVECFIFFYNVRKISIFLVNEDGLLDNEFIVIVEILNKLDEEDF